MISAAFEKCHRAEEKKYRSHGLGRAVCVSRFISPAVRNFIAGRTIFLVESAANKGLAMSEIRGSVPYVIAIEVASVYYS